MKHGSLGLAVPYPLTDARQFLNGNPATGAFRLSHYLFGHAVIDVGDEPRFTARPSLQSTFP